MWGPGVVLHPNALYPFLSVRDITRAAQTTVTPNPVVVIMASPGQPGAGAPGPPYTGYTQPAVSSTPTHAAPSSP